MSLENFLLGESLSDFNAKLNLLVAGVNGHTATLTSHAEILRFIQEQVITKLDQKPYFFNTTADMINCDYLEDNNCCYVLGNLQVYDGRMRLFYISNDSSLVADGTEIIELIGSPGLKAKHIMDTNESELRGLINENSEAILDLAGQISDNANALDPTKLTAPVPINKGGTGSTTVAAARTALQLYDGITLSEVSTSSTASWSSTAALDGVTRYYYTLSVSGFTANTRFTLAFKESKYATEEALKAAKTLLNNIIAVDSIAGGIRFYASSQIAAEGVVLYFDCFRMFN